jgi:hypothetical protein
MAIEINDPEIQYLFRCAKFLQLNSLTPDSLKWDGNTSKKGIYERWDRDSTVVSNHISDVEDLRRQLSREVHEYGRFVRFAPHVTDMVHAFSKEGQLKRIRSVADKFGGIDQSFLQGLKFASEHNRPDHTYFVSGAPGTTQVLFIAQSEQEILDRIGVPRPVRRLEKTPEKVTIKSVVIHLNHIRVGLETKARVFARSHVKKDYGMPDLSTRQGWMDNHDKISASSYDKRYQIVALQKKIEAGLVSDNAIKKGWEIFEVGEVHRS